MEDDICQGLIHKSVWKILDKKYLCNLRDKISSKSTNVNVNTTISLQM